MQRKGGGALADPASMFSFLAGHPALDFVNSVANRLDVARSRDLLRSTADLRRWLAQGGLRVDGSLSEQDLRWARRLRQHLHRLFVAIALRDRPDVHSLSAVDQMLRTCQAKRCLALDDGRIVRAWSETSTAIERTMWPVLSAAVDLLQSTQSGLIRQCDGEGCGWLFVDRSRGRKRRWCSMRDCGNRAKAYRHYHRGRVGRTPRR
jgi:predicted RNA-binding Zn ribbon-like protein